MAAQYIIISVTEGVGTITLNRPLKRNALNGPFIQELLQALERLAADKQAQVVLIHATGPHFCAGADITWMQKMALASEDENYTDAQHLADLMYQLYVFPKPTIVLAHGSTLGGGLGLVSASDIALAAQDAHFGFPEVKIGLAASTISPYVISAIGERAAHYYFLTGENFGVEEAQRLGLVHRVTKKESLLSEGLLLAKRVLENSPHAMTEIKQLLRKIAQEKISRDLSQKTAEHLANLRTSVEAQEGLQAFLEKRKPTWSR
jgi:methylglutaconyl-CoA hydratase